MPTSRCHDIDVHYDERGTGPVIVWLPGTGLRGATWERQAGHFSSSYRCLTVDLRGSGQSSGAGTAFTVADLAGDIACLLDGLGIATATVIGLSLGSAIAQDLASARPEMVDRLVLLATWSSSSAQHHIRRHFASRLYALEHGPLDVFQQFAFWMSSPTLLDEEPERQAEVEQLLRTHSSATPQGLAGHFRADLSHETRDRLGRVSCPGLVLHGDEDLITLPRYNQDVAAQIPGAQLAVIPRAGHLAWLERADEVSAVIGRFLGCPPGVAR